MNVADVMQRYDNEPTRWEFFDALDPETPMTDVLERLARATALAGAADLRALNSPRGSRAKVWEALARHYRDSAKAASRLITARTVELETFRVGERSGNGRHTLLLTEEP